MFKKISEYFEPILSPQCDFRKEFSVQHYLSAMLEE